MASIEILSSKQSFYWKQRLEKTGYEDIYFYPEYASIFNSVDEGSSLIYIYEEGNNIFLYPFRFRQLAKIKKFAEFSEWADITSDYGFGGPLVTMTGEIENKKFIKNAVHAFDDYCKDNKIVSEFCRFHPLLENTSYLKDEYNPIFCNQTVWVDLTLSEEELWHQMRRNHRQDIRRAEDLGIEVEISDLPNAADSFHKIYIQTMQDVGADSYYFFNEDFFQRTIKYLNDHAVIFLARYQNKIISGVLYIWGNNFSHAHFSAMDREFSYLRPNKLLHYRAILWSKKKGLKKLHLGGGTGGSDTDSLMHFKSGFSKLRAEFYIAKRIHNPKIYNNLCQLVNVNPDTEPFFPLICKD